MSAPVRLVISGYCGRMGSRIAALASTDGAFRITGALEHAGHACVGRDAGECLGLRRLGVRVSDDAERAIAAADVLIEFSSPVATLANLRVARRLKRRVVIGTTGLKPAQQRHIAAASRTIPVLQAPNMSVGVNLLFELAAQAAGRLGEEYQLEIVEAHHRHKQDAPSGTAKRLAEVVAGARRVPAARIPVHAIRAGDIVGDHTLLIAGPGERLELTHRAHSRDTFAQGALRAAQFLARQRRPGLFGMQDVLRSR